MAFNETASLPDCIALGAAGGPMFSTDVIIVRAGYESRNANWSQSRRKYDISTGIKYKWEFQAVSDLFHAVGGRLDGFRFKDWADFEATTTTGALAGTDGTSLFGTAGIGYGLGTLQLTKKYPAGSATHIREIRKPIAVTIYRNGVAQTAGGGPGNYSVDLTTGIVTFIADQTRSITSHTVGAGHVFTLASAFSPNLAIGGRIYVAGVGGTAATILNGLSHAITNVAGAVITTSTVTTGLTASSGTASYFPQPTDTVTWAGTFDVPVRFDSDQLEAVIQDKTGAGELLITAPIQLIELKV